MAYEQHQASAQRLVARCAVLTLSDSRDESTDLSGRRIRELLSADGHGVAHYEVLREDPPLLEARLSELLGHEDVDAVVVNGGTGVSPRDRTVSIVERHLDLPLPGFGELFRMLSWDQIGSGAMLSRAVGGIARDKPLFALPGSTRAVELGMTMLILPELRHLLTELRR